MMKVNFPANNELTICLPKWSSFPLYTFLFILLFIGGSAKATIVTLDDYYEFADSPFHSYSFSSFYLEDFEDGTITDNDFETPGVSETYGFFRISHFQFPSIDSVDGDDGNIDGSGSAGGSMYNGGILEFVFDEGILGALPTHAGLVWTDGTPNHLVSFSAYDEFDNLIGLSEEVLGDGSFYGTTDEDFFFGAIHTPGIKRLLIHDNGGLNNLEIDHLQYGIQGAANVPEPKSLLFIAICLISLVLLRRLSNKPKDKP